MLTIDPTANSVLRAHSQKVNGVIAFDPTISNASLVLDQAHAVLVVARMALQDGSVQDKIVSCALSAVETLLETGIRSMRVGHSDLLADATYQ